MLAPLEPSLVPYNPGNEVPMSQQGTYSGPSLRFKCIYLQTRQNRTCTTSPFPTATPVQNGCSVPLDTCLPPNKIPGGGEESFHLKILLRLQGPAPAQEAASRHNTCPTYYLGPPPGLAKVLEGRRGVFVQ